VLELERMGQTEVAWDDAIPDAPVLALARARELREVLLNLLENARLAGARRVRLAVTVEGDVAQLQVADDGSGIPEHLLSRIFDPHFSTRTSGSGLGLAISRRLIDGWGGSITAERGILGGAVLIIRLARAPRT
jgi:signal transduction histidine kinase